LGCHLSDRFAERLVSPGALIVRDGEELSVRTDIAGERAAIVLHG